MKKIYTIIVLVMLSFDAFAQETILGNEEVEVIKDFQVKLESTKIKSTTPEEIVIPKVNRKYEYKLTTAPLILDYPAPYIRPVAFKEEIKMDLYNYYAKLGYGSMKNPLLHLVAAKTVEDYYTIGLNLQHEGINEGSTDDKKRRFSLAHLFSDYYINDGIKTELDLTYNRELLGIYGFNHLEDPFPRLGVRNFSNFGANWSLNNGNGQNTSHYYNLGLDYDFHSVDDVLQKEHDIILSGLIEQSLGNNLKVSLELGADFTFVRDTVENFDAHLYYIKPRVTSQFKGIGINGGVDIVKSHEKLHLLPVANLSTEINKELSIELSYADKVEKQNLEYFRNTNPFFRDMRDSVRLLKERDISLQARYESDLDFNISGKVSYLSRKDPITFFNLRMSGLLDHVFFDYDNVQVELLGNYQITPAYSVNAGFQLNNYSLDRDHDPWHLPKFTATLNGIINLLGDRLSVAPTLLFRSNVSRVISDTYDDDGSGIDFSIESNFRVSKNINAFVKLNNLLDSHYQRWTGQQEFSRNVQGGIEIKF